MKWPKYYLAALLVHAVVFWCLHFPAPLALPAKAEHPYVEVLMEGGPGAGDLPGAEAAGGAPAAPAEISPSAPTPAPMLLAPPVPPEIPTPPPVVVQPAPAPLPIPVETIPLPEVIAPPPVPEPAPVLPAESVPVPAEAEVPGANPAVSSGDGAAGNPGGGIGAGAGLGTGPGRGSGAGDGGEAVGHGPRLLSGLNVPIAPGGQSGSVLLRIYVNTVGAIDKVEVAVSSGRADLDQTGIETVKRAHYQPANDGNGTVAGRLEVRITWTGNSMFYSWKNGGGP